MRREVRMLQRLRHPHIVRLYGVYESANTVEIAFELSRGGQISRRILLAALNNASSSCGSNGGTQSYELLDAVPTNSLANRHPKHLYTFNEMEISRVIRQVLTAIVFMHEIGYAHGDLKPEHLLYSNIDPEAKVLIVDFGKAGTFKALARRIRLSGLQEHVVRSTDSKEEHLEPQRDEDHHHHHRHRSIKDLHELHFRPPWLVLAHSHLQQHNTDQGLPRKEDVPYLDVWAMGVVIYTMVFGAFPFTDEEYDVYRSGCGSAEDVSRRYDALTRVLTQIEEPLVRFPAHLEDSVSRAGKDLLLKMLHKTQRITAKEVLDHPWISGGAASTIPFSRAHVTHLQSFCQEYEQSFVKINFRQSRKQDEDDDARTKLAIHSPDVRSMSLSPTDEESIVYVETESPRNPQQKFLKNESPDSIMRRADAALSRSMDDEHEEEESYDSAQEDQKVSRPKFFSLWKLFQSHNDPTTATITATSPRVSIELKDRSQLQRWMNR